MRLPVLLNSIYIYLISSVFNLRLIIPLNNYLFLIIAIIIINSKDCLQLNFKPVYCVIYGIKLYYGSLSNHSEYKIEIYKVILYIYKQKVES